MPYNAKQAGASYEALFAAEALRRGLNVLQPFGDYLAYDLIVENKRNKITRVQVKGTTHKQTGRNSTYKISASSGNCKSGKTKITEDKADVIAIYVAPVDIWYHVPTKHVKAATMTMRPVSDSKAQYEIWRDAWNTYF